MPRRPTSGAALVFALLVLATLAAFGWAQRVKRDPLILDHVRFRPVPRVHLGAAPPRGFTPNGDCRFDRERIRFRMTQTDSATVQVIKPGGRLVDTLARERPLHRYHFFTFYWDGRDRRGGTALPGRYKLRVKLRSEGRTLVAPGVIKLHRAPRRGEGLACGRGTGATGSGAAP